MDQHSILEKWVQNKSTMMVFFKLKEPCFQEYEYKGPQWGHPSNYAYVKFNCEPSDELCFLSKAAWPNTIESDSRTKLEEAVCEAIVDALMSHSIFPHRGCSLILVEVKWDAVMSSELSFYRAAKEAMNQLIDRGEWQLETTKA